MRRVCVCISTDRKVSCQYYVPFSVDTERYVGALVDTSTLLSQNVGSPSKNVAFGLLTHLNPFFFSPRGKSQIWFLLLFNCQLKILQKKFNMKKSLSPNLAFPPCTVLVHQK